MSASRSCTRGTYRNATTALIVCACALSAACSESSPAWSEARRADTIDAYEQFLAEYPQARQARKASARLEELKFPLAGMGLTTLERRNGAAYACGAPPDASRRSVSFTATKDTLVTTAQLKKHFGLHAEGGMGRAGPALSGVTRSEAGMVFFGDLCFEGPTPKDPIVQVTGSFVSTAAGWELSKGTIITLPPVQPEPGEPRDE